MTNILDAVAKSLEDFRPKTHRQFVVFNIATRFGDARHLARYLNVCEQHPKRVLLEAARLAEREISGTDLSPVEPFFRRLQDWKREEAG